MHRGGRTGKDKAKAKGTAAETDTPTVTAASAAVQPPPPPLRRPLTVHPAPSHAHGRVWRKAASVSAASLSPRSEASQDSAPAAIESAATGAAAITAQALRDLSSSAPFPLELLPSAAAASTTAASAAASAHNIAGRSSPATSVSSSTSELEGRPQHRVASAAATAISPTAESPNPLVLSFDFDTAAAHFAPDPQHLQLLAQHAQLESLQDATSLALQQEREEKAALERTAQMRAEQLEQTRKLLEAAQAAERHAELQAQQQAHTNELLNSQLVAARTESEVAAGNYLAAIQDMQAHTQRTVELHQQTTARQSAQLGREAAMAFLAAAVAESAKRAPPPPASVDLAEHERVLEEFTALRRAHSELEHAHSALTHSRAHMQSQRILELEAGMDLLTTSTQLLQDELDALHPKAEQSRLQLDDALEQVAAARDALKAEQIAHAQTKTAHVSETAALKAELQKQADSYASLQSQKADLARELSHSQARLQKAASKSTELQSLQHELDKARTAHEELQALYGSTKEAYRESQAKASRTAASMEKLRQAKETLTAQLEKSERERTEMQRKLDFAAGASSVHPNSVHRTPAMESESKANGTDPAAAAASAASPPSSAAPFSPSLASPSPAKAGPSDRRLRRELSDATTRLAALDREGRVLRNSLTRSEAANKLLRQRLNIKAKVVRAKSPSGELSTPQQSEPSTAFNTPPTRAGSMRQQEHKDDEDAEAASHAEPNSSSARFAYSSPISAQRSPAATTQLLTPIAAASAASPSSTWPGSLNASFLSDPAAVLALRADFHEMSAQHSQLQEELDSCQQLLVDAMQDRDAAISARSALQSQLDQHQRLLASQSSSIDDARDTTIHAVEHMRARTGEVEALQALHLKRAAEFERQLAHMQSELSHAQMLVRASDAVLHKERMEFDHAQQEQQKEQIKRQREQAELLSHAQQRLHEVLHPPPTALAKLIVFRHKDMRVAPEQLRELCAELVLQTRYVSRAWREWAPYRTDCVTALHYLLNSLVSKYGQSACICFQRLVSMGAFPKAIEQDSHGAWAALEVTSSDQLMPGDLIFLAGKRGDPPKTRCKQCMEDQKKKMARDPSDQRVNHAAMVISGDREIFHSSVQCQGGCIESLDSLYKRYTSFANAEDIRTSTDSRKDVPEGSVAAAADLVGVPTSASAASGSADSISLADLAAATTASRSVDVSTMTAMDASTSTEDQEDQDSHQLLKPVPDGRNIGSHAASDPASSAQPNPEDAALSELECLRVSLDELKQQLVEQALVKDEMEEAHQRRLHELGEQAQQQREQHREQIADLERTFDHVRADLETQLELMKQAQNALALEDSQKLELQAAAEEVSQLRATLQERVTRIDELQSLLDAEQKRVAELEAASESARTLSVAASETVLELEAALEQQKQQITTSTSVVEKQKGEIAQLQIEAAEATRSAAVAASAIEAAKAETFAARIAVAEADAAAIAAAAAVPLPAPSASSRSHSPSSSVDRTSASLDSAACSSSPSLAPLDVSSTLESSDAIETLPVLPAEDFAAEISLLTFGEDSAPSVSNSPRAEVHSARVAPSATASPPRSAAAGRSASISPSSPLPPPPTDDVAAGMPDGIHASLAPIAESPPITRWGSSTERPELLALVETQARGLEQFIGQNDEHQRQLNKMREEMDAARVAAAESPAASTAALATATAAAAALQSDLDAAQSQLAQQRSELQQLQQALTAQEELTRHEHEAAELSQAASLKQAADTQEIHNKLTADLSAATQRAEHAESEWAVAEERATQVESELKSMTLRAEQAESKLAALQLRLDSTTASLAAASADASTTTDRVHSLEDEVKTLNTAITRAHSDALESLGALEQAGKDRSDLQARLDVALKEQESSQTRLAELQQQLDFVKDSSSKSASDAAAAVDRIESLEDEVRSLNSAIARSHHDALEALSAQEVAQQAIVDLQARFDDVQKQLNASKLEVAQANSAITAAKSEIAAAAADSAESIAALEDEVRLLNSAIARAHSDALESLEAQQIAEKARVGLQAQLTETQLQLQTMQTELSDSQRQQQVLAAELAEAQLEAESAARVAADHAHSLDEQIVSLSSSLANAHKEAVASLSADRQAEVAEVLAGAARRHQEELDRLNQLHASQLSIAHSENEVSMKSELYRLRLHHDAEVASLRAGFNESAVMEGMRKDIARLTDERGARQRERKVLQGRIQANVKEAAAAKLREESLMADLAAAKATSAALLAQVVSAPPSLPSSPRVEQNDVVDELASLRSQLAIAQSQLHAVTAELAGAQSQAAVDSSDIASTVKEHGELQSLYTQLGEDYETLAAAEAQRAKDVARLTSELQGLRVELQEARKQAVSTEDTLQQGALRETALEETLATLEGELKQELAAKQTLQAQVDELQAASATAHEKASLEMRSRLELEQQENAELQSRLQEVEAQVQAKADRCLELETALAAASAVSEDAFSLEDLTALQADLIQLQQELQDADARCETRLAEQKQVHDAAFSALLSSDKRALLEAEDALVAARRECASLRHDLSKEREALVEERLARAGDQAAAPALVNLQRESARLAAHVAEQSGMERAALLEIIRVQKVELEQAGGLKRTLAESSGLALARMMEEGRDAVAEKEKLALALMNCRADVQRLELYARGVEQQLRATVPRSPAVRPPALLAAASPLSPQRSNGGTPSSRALQLGSPHTPGRGGPLSPLDGGVLSPSTSTPTRRLRVTAFGDADASSVSVDSAKGKAAATAGPAAPAAERT